MLRNLLLYILVWLPAFVVAFFSDSSSLLPLKWVLAVVMLAGWCANTAIISRIHWRGTLAGILIYLGAHLIVLVALYVGVYNPVVGVSHTALRLAGALSFTPVSVMAYGLFRPDVPQEMYGTMLIFGALLVGWFVGVCAWRKK